ncbi:MAG: hypothetical protein CMF96_11515 [Candidatus Marinimicrobia bacterium]|nr:hypothetical protein [Candidatus Neomarinimicrobiota bacterium]|tara:strand:+ start:1844 stop:2866 length:1023 start_codon:yes stop_codon:yes gene_type:complete
MILKRIIPLLIVISIGSLTLFGHFINIESIQDFVNNDSTQWFDIISSFAIFLGSLNLIKMQSLNIIKKRKNWQYSILTILSFIFVIFAGFFFRGSNYIEVSGVTDKNKVAEMVLKYSSIPKNQIIKKIDENNGVFEIPKIFILKSSAEKQMEEFLKYSAYGIVKQKKWGAHLNTDGSLFYWIFDYIYTPLSATMFALLAFFVASASYRAFRIRNFEATLLLVSGVILMLGRVPIGALIPAWTIGCILVFSFGAFIAPMVKNRKILFGIILLGLIINFSLAFVNGFNPQSPSFLFLPNLQSWIFNVPTSAGARAIMIGIALGIVGTSLRIITGLERSFLGE